MKKRRVYLNREKFLEGEYKTTNECEIAIAYLMQLAKDRGQEEMPVLVVSYTKKQLDGSIFSGAVGEKAVKELQKGTHVKIGNLSLSLATEKDFPYQFKGVVLNLYCLDKLLDKIDNLSDVTDILTITWNTTSYEEWVSTWDAQEILGNDISTTSKLQLSDIVMNALDSLKVCINLSTGLTHPSDKERCDSMFRILKKNKQNFTPRSVYKYCVNSGWPTRSARDVEKMAEKIAKLKTSGRVKKCWAENIYDQWTATKR